MNERRDNRRRTDDVTGLSNLSHFMEETSFLVRGSGEGTLAFIYMDIENFKEYNQSYGFQAGNEFLRQIAELLKESFPDAVLARLHEDHFVVVVMNEQIVERIERVEERVKGYAKAAQVVMKAGIYVPDSGITDVALILDRAKLACESIKRLYDKYWCYFDESLEEQQKLRQYIASHFQTALERGEIQVYYQPEIRVMTREICGFEALARWLDPDYGMISPGVFVEVLEQAHLSDKLDLYIIRQVCLDLQTIRARESEGCKPTRVSVNLSRVDFLLQDMFGAIEEICRETGTRREQLHIEVTESAIGDELMQEELNKFRQAGYELWMDDFGSGYSSLNTLVQYEFDVLKIDMQFMRDFDKQPKTRTLLKGIVNLAKDLGLHTLTEGVETEEQFEFLRSIGCEIVQGYLFGRPLPLEETIRQHMNSQSGLGFEPLDSAKYYHDIGTLNVLSTFPFASLEERRDQLNDLAFAILEHAWEGETRCLYANNEFRNFLISVGVSGLEELERQFSSSDLSQRKRYQRLVLRGLKTGQEQMSDTVVNGNICNIRIKAIAHDHARNRVAIGVIAVNSSASESSRRGAYTRLALQHLLELFTRIDLFNERGAVVNLYVGETQGRVTDIVATNRGAVLRYAQEYIAFGERWQFCRFYDMRVVPRRLHESGENHLSALFHTKNDFGDMRLELYTIIPFNFDGQMHYLSLVRDVSNVGLDLPTGMVGRGSWYGNRDSRRNRDEG